ncbi:LysR family transcriptional regulator [Kitasatospora sp. NPDC059463]|uniref:LysR family transcriptional regulator n=1 Tax=unclassified Kitasatospora TaxID=2633591 RepID=UPI0036841313
MDIRQLTTFHRAATLLSFSGAAAELNYAQSTVTGQIRALENSVGVALFERLAGRRVRLTLAGERLLPFAERLLSLADEALVAAAGPREPSGRLAVGVMDSLAAYRLAPLFEYFRHRYPRLHLAPQIATGSQILHDLREGRVDLGLLTCERVRHEGLESEVLGPEPLVAVVSPGHDLARRARITGADLREVPVLAPESGSGRRHPGGAGVRGPARGPGAAVAVLECGSAQETKRWAAAGLVVGLLPRVSVEADLAAGRLAALAWRPPVEVHTQLVRRPRTPLTREMRLFIEQVSAFLLQEQDLAAA